MEQVNEVVNNVTACLGAVLPLEEATDALKKITASEKMLKDDEASIKTEYIHSSKQRSERSVSQIPSKSSKTVHDIIVDVSRSISHVSSVRESSASKNLPKSVAEVSGLARSHSNASTKSTASKNSTKSAEAEVVEVPVARSCSSVSVKSWASKKSSKSVDDAVSSRSSASTRTDDVSKTPIKSNEEISEVEESSDVNKTSSSILNQVKLIDLTSESHIAVSYGSAEEGKTVVKNTQHKCWPKIGKAVALVCIFCALALVSYTVITVGGLNRNQSQSSQEQFLINNDEPTFSPTFSPTYYTYMPTYAPTPDATEEIATEKEDRKQSSQEQVLINDEPTFSPTYYTNMPTYAPTRDATEEIATGKDWKGKKGEAV